MGFVGKQPTRAALTEADITDGIIVNADINASAAIAMSKTALSAGTGISLSTNTLNVDAAQTGITSLLATDIKIGEDDQTKIDFEDANKINFYANNAKEVELAENSLSPGSSDGTALGTTSLMWSDLFLASGGVINLNDGDVTITHASGKLTSTGDLELLRDANNADVKVTLGTSAAESLIIQVLNGGSNKTAEEVHFSTATASATADHGKMVFDIDGTDILTIDDGGLVIKTTGTIGPVGDEDLITLTASGNIVTVAGELSATTLDIGGTNITSTAGELNLLDGSAKSTSSITLADADAFIVIDGTTTKQIPASDISTYIGSGGSSVDLVADGSISAGDRVAITSDGKAKTIAALQTNTGNTQLNAINDNGMGAYMSMDADPDTNRFLVVYRDTGNSNYMTGLVVDVASDGTFSEGSEVVISSNAAWGPSCVVYDPSVDRFAVFVNYSNRVYGHVATIDNSDNSVSFGSALEIYGQGNQLCPTGAAYDPDTERVILSWVATDTSPDEIRAAVVTLTGSSTNTMAVGTSLNLSGTSGSNQGNTNAGYGFDPHLVYDTEVDRAVCVWQDASGHPTSVVLTVTGGGTNTLAAGSEVEITTDSMTWTNAWPAMIYDDTSNKIVYGIYDGNAARGEIWIGTTTGGGTNTVTWSSSPTNLVSGDSMYHLAMYPANDGSGNIVYSFRDDTKTNGTDLIQVGVGRVSGTGSSASFSSIFQTKIYTTYLGDAHLFIRKGGTGNKICVFTEEAADLYAGVPDLPDNAPDFIGIANSAISDTATGTITTVGGVGTNQSSLSAGVTYFLDGAGALTTSATDYPKIGPALTSSTILIGNINTY